MQELGATMVGVSDAFGAIRNDDGIDAQALVQHMDSDGGKLAEFEGAEAISAGDLYEISCDVFFPAALGGMIHEDNAGLLDCRMIVEGANNPTTFAADEILDEKNVYVVPDLMANAGGVVASYFEWVQNLQHFRWDEREVNDKLGAVMRRTFREVSMRAEKSEVNLRDRRVRVGDRARGRGLPHPRLRGLTRARGCEDLAISPDEVGGRRIKDAGGEAAEGP